MCFCVSPSAIKSVVEQVVMMRRKNESDGNRSRPAGAQWPHRLIFDQLL